MNLPLRPFLSTPVARATVAAALETKDSITGSRTPLTSLKISAELTQDLSEQLVLLKYSVADEVADDPEGEVRLEVSAIRRASDKKLVMVALSIDKAYLDEPEHDEIKELRNLCDDLKETLRCPALLCLIFCEKLDWPARKARKVIFNEWPLSGVKATFVPWRDVLEFRKAAPPARKAIVAEILSSVTSVGRVGGSVRLEFDELTRLTQILQNHPKMQDLRSRQTVLSQAGIANLVSNIPFTDTPEKCAAILMMTLPDKGDVPDRPGVHALGALLISPYFCSDLSGADLVFVDGLVAKYSLAPK